MAKAKGTILYIDEDNSDTYQDVGCIFGVKPPGFSRGVIDGEPCLGDGIQTQDTGALTRTPLDFTLQSNPSATGTDLHPILETAIKADTNFKWCILHPLATPVYQFGEGKLSELDFEEFEVETEMKNVCQIQPTADWTWSATPPTLDP